MKRRAILPWLTPVLVGAEVGLVWSGWLSLSHAIVAGLVIETLVWLTVFARVAAGLRQWRSDRAAGLDAWQAAEDGLARLSHARWPGSSSSSPGSGRAWFGW